MPGVPLTIEPDPEVAGCATLLVDGWVAGRPYRFVLDTGAGRSTVVCDGYTSTLPSHAEHTPAGAIAARSEDLVMVTSVRLGSHVVPTLEVGRGSQGRNLLGMDFLGSVALQVDFDRAELWLVESGTLATRWPLQRSPWGHPFVDVHWPGVTGRACWDTGAAVTVVNRAFFAEHRDLFQPAGMSTGIDAHGAQAPLPLYLMRTAKVGDLTLGASTAAVLDLPQTVGRMDLVLGYPALSQANWTFDFPTNRWSASPRAGVVTE
jgi:hypothetical protein